MTTAIESLLLDELVQWGDPWHGVWRGDTLKIHTPNGPVVDCPGVAPDQSPWGTSGDCWKLQIPGLATPTNDAADVTAGRTWLNYAIISGYFQRLYGKSGAAIYLDPSNKPWRIQLSPSWSFSGSPAINGSAMMSLNLVEFGKIGDTGVSQALAQQSVSFGIMTPTTGTEGMWIEDMTSDGRSLLFHVSCWWANSQRRCLGIFKLDISGTPPAASFTWTKLADEASTGSDTASATVQFKTAQYKSTFTNGNYGPPYYWEYQSSNNVPVNTWPTSTHVVSSMSYTRTINQLMGGRFDGATAKVMTLSAVQTASGSGDIAGAGTSSSFTASGSFSYTCTWSIKAAGTVLFSQSETGSATRSGSGDVYNMGAAIETVNGSMTFDGVTTTVSGSGVPWESKWINWQSWPYMGISPGVNIDWVKGLRYSNSLYGLLYALGVNVKFMGCAVKIGSDSSTKTATSYTGGPRYASEHPVSGQIVWDTVPVCWV